jgi:large subunit ribosomal protein L3
MAGHMGCRRSTVENLRVVSIMEEDNLLIVNGAVPGATGGYVVVRISATRGAK